MVNASKLLFQQNISGAFLRKPLIVGLLEFLEGAHQLGMRHHRVGRNARLGLKFIVSINIHMVLLGYGQVFAARAAAALRRVPRLRQKCSSDVRKVPARERYSPRQNQAAAIAAAPALRNVSAGRVTASGLEAVLEALRFEVLFHGVGREARAHLDVAALLGFRSQRLVLRGALAARSGAMFGLELRIGRHAALQISIEISIQVLRKVSPKIGGRHTLVVEAALVHGIGLAHEDVRGHFVFGAAKLTERCQKDQIIKCLGG